MSKATVLLNTATKTLAALLKLPFELRYLVHYIFFSLAGGMVLEEWKEDGTKRGVILVFPGFSVPSNALSYLQSKIATTLNVEVIVVQSRWGLVGINRMMVKADQEFLKARKTAQELNVPLLLVGYSFGSEVVLRLNEKYRPDIAHCYLMSPPVNRAPLLLAFPFFLTSLTAIEILLEENLMVTMLKDLDLGNVTIAYGERDGIAPSSEESYPDSVRIKGLSASHIGMLFRPASKESLIAEIERHFV